MPSYPQSYVDSLINTVKAVTNEKAAVVRESNDLKEEIETLKQQNLVLGGSSVDLGVQRTVLEVFGSWIEEIIAIRGYKFQPIDRGSWMIFKDDIEVVLLIIEHDGVEYKLRPRSTSVRKLGLNAKSKFASLIDSNQTKSVSNINTFFGAIDMVALTLN